MPPDDRTALGAEQAALVRALMTGDGPPDGVNAAAVERGRRLLEIKQGRIQQKRNRKNRRRTARWRRLLSFRP